MDQEKIGKFIAESRKKKELTQEQLATKLGVNSKSISRWETGKCMPDLSVIKILCDTLDISINDLLSGEKIKKEDYESKLEENIINVTNYSQNKNMKRTLIIIIEGFILSILFVAIIILSLNSFSGEGFNFWNIDDYIETKGINKRINNNDYTWFIDNLDYNKTYEEYIHSYGYIIDDDNEEIIYDTSHLMSFEEYRDFIQSTIKNTIKKYNVGKLITIDSKYYNNIFAEITYLVYPNITLQYSYYDDYIVINFSSYELDEQHDQEYNKNASIYLYLKK